jgi:hypothetical protein
MVPRISGSPNRMQCTRPGQNWNSPLIRVFGGQMHSGVDPSHRWLS